MKKILLVLGGMLLFILLLPAFIDPPRGYTPSEPPVVTTGKALLKALDSYEAEFGEYPAGEHAEILQALAGENPSEEVFFQTPRRKLNAAGELLDPWGTPYRFFLPPDAPEPRVQSAGPNGKFEQYSKESDDYYSWHKGTGQVSGGIPGLPF